MLIEVWTSFNPFILKPNPNLPMPKIVKDQGSTINLPKCSRIDSLEKVLMLENTSGIDDHRYLYRGQNVCCDFSIFPSIPIKRIGNRLSTISLPPFLMFLFLVFYRCRRGSTISRTFMRITYANHNCLMLMSMRINARRLLFLCGFFTYLNSF
jgi:hypothetical protein